MALGPALQNHFSWSPSFTSSPTAERKVFDNDCKAWQQWQDQELTSNPARRSRTLSSVDGTNRNPRNSLEVPSSSNPFTPLQETTFRNTHHHPSHVSLYASSGKGPRSDASQFSPASSTSFTTLAPPTRKLSRAMRVFVAWKRATSPASDDLE